MSDAQDTRIHIHRHHARWIVMGLVVVVGLVAYGFYNYGGRVAIENGHLAVTQPDLTPLKQKVEVKQPPQLAQQLPPAPQPVPPAAAPTPETDLQKIAAAQQDLAKQLNDLVGRVSMIETRLAQSAPAAIPATAAAATTPTQLVPAALPPTAAAVSPPAPPAPPTQLAQAQPPAAGAPQIQYYTGVPQNWHVGQIHGQQKAEGCLAPKTLVLSDQCTPLPNGGKHCSFTCQ